MNFLELTDNASPLMSLRERLAGLPDNYLRFILLIGLVLWSAIALIRHPDIPLLNTRTYDPLVRQRLIQPPPDPDIVIVDIDEASLAYMNQDFGRWPWPRDTLAATLYWLEKQGAKAVVFDILFSDADQLNKASDESFASAIAQSKISYFPILRLNAEHDAISQVKTNQLKGFVSPIKEGVPDTTLAVIPPLFETAMQTQRLGYHNVHADKDGIIRHYRYWEDQKGWRIWSLPARMAQDFGWRLPPQATPLINWHGTSLAHQTIPFKDVWQLSQQRDSQKPDARFQGKIILIGATATSLFDVKTTPIAALHPGVDLLATAIDNVKNERYLLRVSAITEFLFTLLALGLVYWISSKLAYEKIKWAMMIIPSLMIGFGFVTLHWGHWYIDLSLAATQGFIFFGMLTGARSARLNHWSHVANLGERGYTQAWAVSPRLGALPAEWLDRFLPVTLPMTLQNLCWQRRTDRSDSTVLILRVSAPTEAALIEGSTVLQTRFKTLLAQGDLLALIHQAIQPFDISASPIFHKTWQEKLKAVFNLRLIEHPFFDLDNQLAAQLLMQPLQSHNATR